MLTRRQLVVGTAGLLAGRSAAAEIGSAGGVLDVSLEASEEWVVLGGTSARMYTYNRLPQAPRLVASPGDVVRLRLANELTEDTNLHYHGLHVSPVGTADDVFARVAPGESRQYEFEIPSNHPGGTFWYHPHIHGATARQVSRGLAGVLVIKGELDRIPAIAAMPEQFLVLQDLDLDASGFPVEPSMMERMQGREGALVTTSGDVNPSIPIAAGGWVRLRILNASASRYYRLALEQHTMYKIAGDGGPLPAPEPATEIVLTPGQRVELAVQGQRSSGTYALLSLPYDRGSAMMGGGMMSRMGMTAASGPITLATIQYTGSVAPSGLPAQLVSTEPLPAPTLPLRRVTLGMGMRMTFTINGRLFDHHRIDVRANLGTVEDWEFVNATGMDHPMHVHTNPFQVLDTSGAAVPVWRDTFNVPANSRVRIRTRFADHTGLSVFHCHILDHEDMGMMATLHLES